MSDGAVSDRPTDISNNRVPAAWAGHLGALAASLALLGLVFAPDIKAAVTVWWIYPAYSHCFLIIPISAWLVWEKRESLKADIPSCSPAALLAVIPLLLFWVVGRFASITEARQFAFIGFAEVFIAAILGWAIFRKIMFACLYLLFLVPTGQYLIPTLQNVTAKFVEWGLSALSIPYFRDGLVFELVNGRYEIAEACAGLRFLVATVALGVLFAHLTYRSKTKIAIFLASCFVVPVVGNGIRALLTVMVANYSNNKVAAGFDHIVYGWVFAVAIIMLILYVGSKYGDPDLPVAKARESFTPRTPRYTALAGALGGIAATLCVLLAISQYAAADVGSIDSKRLEQVTGGTGWSAAAPSRDWQVDFSPPAARIARRFVPPDNAAAPVDLAVYYYARGAKSASMLASLNNAWQKTIWHPTEQRGIRETAGDNSVAVDETVIESGNSKRLVWTTYWIDGYFTTSSPLIRLLELRSGLMHGHSAIIVLSTPITGSYAEAQSRLRSLLSSFKNFSTGLARAGAATKS